MPSSRLRLSFAIACMLASGTGRANAQASCTEALGCYLDEAGEERSASAAYLALHHYPDPHYLRAALEESLFLLVGISWYGLDRGRNKADWDFPSARQRFSADVLRFDNNTFPINFLWHPLSGGAYYMAARSNGMHLGPSLIYIVITSMVWEYGLEFRERVSINDLITTPIAGMAVGEVWFSRLLLDADFARLTLDAQAAADNQGEIDLYAETLLAGYYAQHIAGDRTGTSVLVGTGVGYRYRRTKLPGFEDDLSITHLPGLMFDVDELLSFAWLHLFLRVNADFAGVSAWPFARWEAAHPEELTKTVLHRHGYTYGFGGSAQAALDLSLGPARIGASTMFGQYDSKQGLDRTQELLTTDVHVSNMVFDAQSYVRLYPMASHKLALGLAVLSRRRISKVNTFEQRGSQLRATATLGWEL